MWHKCTVLACRGSRLQAAAEAILAILERGLENQKRKEPVIPAQENQ